MYLGQMIAGAESSKVRPRDKGSIYCSCAMISALTMLLGGRKKADSIRFLLYFEVGLERGINEQRIKIHRLETIPSLFGRAAISRFFVFVKIIRLTRVKLYVKLGTGLARDRVKLLSYTLLHTHTHTHVYTWFGHTRENRILCNKRNMMYVWRRCEMGFFGGAWEGVSSRRERSPCART